MANIPIWPGSSSFSPGDTPFGFYDDDLEFKRDAVSVATWCAQRLGYPLIDIELQAINFFTCFEEAVTEYGAQVYGYQIRDNLPKLVGSVTSSIDGSWDNINNVNIKDDFGTLFESNNLGGGSQTGGSYGSTTAKTYSASLDLQIGVQKYDLISSGLVNWESGSNQIENGSLNINVGRIYHYQPAAINRYFDPYAGTGTGIQSLMQAFGFGNYSPGVNFMLMPMYYDILKIQAIELNDTIRKSAYHYEIENDRYLKIFPIPNRDYKLWFDYNITLSTLGGGANPTEGLGVAAPLNTVTDISNVPYANPTYKFINSVGRQWIRKYTLALAKEMLGGIRGKYQSLPIPGETTTLDYSRLLGEAQAEKEALIIQLREDLSELTTERQLARTADEINRKTDAQTGEGRYQIYIH
jgi:hypothetical protein